MRTTLDIDELVLNAVKELAKRQGKTAGEVMSMLARQALTGEARPAEDSVREPEAVCGFRPLPADGKLITNDVIDRLRDELDV
jgi:hypothetical protein